MPNYTLESLVDRYIRTSFSVSKIEELLINEQIGSDLTRDQHYILRYIYQNNMCTTSELAHDFYVKKSAITAIITRLWKKGLIKRTRNPQDRRVIYLTLTEKGKEMYEKTEERIFSLVESFIKQFDPEEIKQFIQIYEKFNRILNERAGRKL